VTEALSGVVTVVSAQPLGSSLSAAVLSGAGTVTVYDASDFAELGGTLRIGGTDPAAQIVAYTATNPDTNVVTLASALAVGWPVDTVVEVWDPAAATPFVDYRALIQQPGDVDNDDVLDCSVTHALIPMLPEGIRDPGEGESVTITSDGGGWTVTDVHGRNPSFDGGRIAPATVTPLQLSFNAGGTTVTIGSTAPVAPVTGDVWFDGNNDYVMNRWNGTAWVPSTFGTNAITAGAITADLIAANAIVAGAIAAGALDAQTITAGALTAGAVSAGSIGAAQIIASTIADCDMVIDPDGGILLIYALSGQTTVNLTTAGANTFSVPAGVTNLDRVETWGGSGGGEGAAANTFGGCGGAGGEYAREDNIAVTPLASLPYTVGVAGAAGANTGAAAGTGGDTNFNSVVTAHGGLGGGTYGAGISVPGATGSTNTFHFNGGNGHSAGGTFGTLGGGGGSSGGSTRSGNAGGAGTNPSTGGVGGAAVVDGGAGGNGGNGGGTGAVGAAGSAPGGGGGGAGGGSTARVGGAGAAGKIRIKYGGARVLVASIAGVAGTDQYGNSYPAGFRSNYAPASTGLTGGYFEKRVRTATQSVTSGATLIYNISSRLISDSGSAYNASTGLWTCPRDGVYIITVAGENTAAVGTSTRWSLNWVLNSTSYIKNERWLDSSNPIRFYETFHDYLIAGDTLSVNVTGLTWTLNSANNMFCATRIG
jgi:hypothetical protein